MTNFQKVKSFMETFGQEVKSSPSFSSTKINELRYNLIKEELDEFRQIWFKIIWTFHNVTLIIINGFSIIS